MKKNNELEQKVKDLLIMYKGKIVEENDKIKLIATNEIQEGKKVECEVSFGYLNSEKYPYTTDVVERTYQILGGRACPHENEDEVLKELERGLSDYHFIRKSYVQMSLFEL